MERIEAIEKLKNIIGCDLRKLAEKYEVPIFKNGHKNKGWAGHVIERYLGLAQNSARSPNFGSWELKVIPLRYKKGGILSIKETMAITMIDAYEVSRNEFEQSHLYNKLKKMVIVSRIFKDIQETESIIYDVSEFDLNIPCIYEQVKKDYELIQLVIRERGFSELSGSLGVFIQPRTKGPGHGSTSRAFYARPSFLKIILGLKDE